MQKSLRNKNYWIFTIIVYVIAVVGVIYIAFNPIEILKVALNEKLSQTYEKKVEFFSVFFPNIWLILKNIFFGILTFGVYVLFSLIYNMLTLGMIAGSLIENDRHSLVYKMISHGVFEVFGIVVSLTAVVFLIVSIIKLMPKIVKREIDVKKVIIDNIKFMIAILLVEVTIFVFSGIIEVVVSNIKVN